MESLVSVLVVFQQPRRPRSKEHPVLEAIGNARRDPVPTSDFQGLRDSPSDEAGTSGTVSKAVTVSELSQGFRWVLGRRP